MAVAYPGNNLRVEISNNGGETWFCLDGTVANISYSSPYSEIVELNFTVIGNNGAFVKSGGTTIKDREQKTVVCEYCKMRNPAESNYCGEGNNYGCGARL